MSGAEEGARRYRENCVLFSTTPVDAVEQALREQRESWDFSGLGLDDNALVRACNRRRSPPPPRPLPPICCAPPPCGTSVDGFFRCVLLPLFACL